MFDNCRIFFYFKLDKLCKAWYNIYVKKIMGYRQAVRHVALTHAFRRFESFYPSHVGASFKSLALIFLQKSEFAHAAAPPFPKKVTPRFPARLQAHSLTENCRYQPFSGMRLRRFLIL